MDNFTFSIPITKVDEAKRMVMGEATREMLDSQGEVIPFKASLEAFGEWPGNVREMHQAKAVGKRVEAVPDESRKSIWVKTYISKGAEDTWQKIKEGVLTTYSVGGKKLEVNMRKWGKDLKPHIDKWRMNELSLVDSGSCPLEPISIIKRDIESVDNADLIKGLLETEFDNPAAERIRKELIVTMADKEKIDGKVKVKGGEVVKPKAEVEKKEEPSKVIVDEVDLTKVIASVDDLTKKVDSITKVSEPEKKEEEEDQEGKVDLTKLEGQFAKIETVKGLEERLEKLEEQPAPAKVKSFVVSKFSEEDEESEELQAVNKRLGELENMREVDITKYQAEGFQDEAWKLLKKKDQLRK